MKRTKQEDVIVLNAGTGKYLPSVVTVTPDFRYPKGIQAAEG